MERLNKKSGFTLVAIAILIAVLAIVGLLGYVVYNNISNSASSDDQETSQAATADDVESAPEINTVDDLNAAETTLDETDPAGSSEADSSQLDTELSAF